MNTIVLKYERKRPDWSEARRTVAQILEICREAALGKFEIMERGGLDLNIVFESRKDVDSLATALMDVITPYVEWATVQDVDGVSFVGIGSFSERQQQRLRFLKSRTQFRCPKPKFTP